MGKITVVNETLFTLDGVMQAPGRPDEDTRDGFVHGGWAVPYQDAVVGSRMGEMMAGANGSLLLGRRTYEDFYSFWPKQKDNPYTGHLNKVRKYVASTTLREPLPWQNSILLNGGVVEAVASLKQQGQNLTILGSGELIQSLLEKGLIDVYVMLIYPIILGTGRRLFPGGGSEKLRLADSVVSTTGVVIAKYEQ